MRSLFVQISLVLLVLLTGLGTAQLLIFSGSWSKFVQDSEQILYSNLAQELALKIQPHVHDTVDYSRLSDLISSLQSLNPHIDSYLLDAEGKIEIFLGDRGSLKRQQLDLRPIKEFLNTESLHSFPIYGPDPRTENTQVVFSVAPIEYGKRHGYLYVTLFGEQKSKLLKMIEARSIPLLVGGTLITTLAMAGLLGTLCFYFLTRRFRRMTLVLDAFRQGDHKVRIQDSRRDEIGELALNFNTMADRIVENIETLRQKDELRRELVQNISHDLRTPLTSVLGYLETIQVKASSLTTSELAKMLEAIVVNIGHLKEIIDELFELSKLDAKEKIPTYRSFEIDELISAVQLKFEDLAQKKAVKFSTSFSERSLKVRGDVAMLSRAISNLVENALNYSRANDSIEISALRQGSKVVVAVRDTGIGIPKEDQANIFQRFYRTKSGHEVHNQGTGLGLAIVQKIVELHGSQVRLESERNQGANFSFELETSTDS